jgi:hypothetical protein
MCEGTPNARGCWDPKRTWMCDTKNPGDVITQPCPETMTGATQYCELDSCFVPPGGNPPFHEVD